jgi:hypothetical protein
MALDTRGPVSSLWSPVISRSYRSCTIGLVSNGRSCGRTFLLGQQEEITRKRLTSFFECGCAAGRAAYESHGPSDLPSRRPSHPPSSSRYPLKPVPNSTCQSTPPPFFFSSSRFSSRQSSVLIDLLPAYLGRASFFLRPLPDHIWSLSFDGWMDGLGHYRPSLCFQAGSEPTF